MQLLKVTLLSAALVGASLSPVKADSDDLAKAILGIAAVGIIAKAINDRDDRRAATSTTIGAGRLGSIEQTHQRPNRIIEGRIRPYEPEKRKTGKGFKKRPLPQACLRVVETQRGDRLAYAARCLDRNYRYASRLPDRCQTAVRTPQGFRTVYGARCLERDGWRVAHR